MTDIREFPFWVALDNIPGTIINTRQKNGIVIQCCHIARKPVSDFFQATDTELVKEYGLSDKAIEAVNEEKSRIPNYSFLVEDLLSQGYGLLPVYDSNYPDSLKSHLRNNAPTLIYYKGNINLINRNCTAIVGSRNAKDISMEFTDNIARMSVISGHPIVSGYAKGIDRHALDCALKYNGESIIVLPQGITTFNSGYRALYREINNNKVLVISTFHPSSQWSTGLAMARNPIIYALADNIYIAESNEKGGTWTGALDGLKKGRTIYVRKPENHEKNANTVLIAKGCKPVSINGERLSENIYTPEPLQSETLFQSVLAEPEMKYISECQQEISENEKIIGFLKKSKATIKDIRTILDIEWDDTRLRKFLDSTPGIIKEKQGKSYTYTLKINEIPTLL